MPFRLRQAESKRPPKLADVGSSSVVGDETTDLRVERSARSGSTSSPAGL